MVTRSTFYQLHLISQLSHYLDSADLAKIYTSITSQLDHCNMLYVELP